MKKIVSICSLAVFAISFSGFAAVAPQKNGTEITAAGDCPIDGKWQIVSAEMAGQTMDMTAENAFWEIGGGSIKATSKSTPESTDKYTRSGNTITIIDSKSGEKQVITITKCTADALTIKVEVEGMTMLQNMKKVK